MLEQIITTNSRVGLSLNGRKKSLTIVNPDEINPAKGYISWKSPLAQAIMNLKTGEKVDVCLPNGNELNIIIHTVDNKSY